MQGPKAGDGAAGGQPVVEQDVFSLSRARQVLALLDRDPAGLRAGDVLPRGWHSAMFAPAVRPRDLRPDGYAGIGVDLPPTDLPRLMFGGRRIGCRGDIRIGAPAERTSRLVSAVPKQGRTGRLLVATVERVIRCGGPEPAVVEQQDFILREAARPGGDEGGGSEPPGADGGTPGGRPFVADEATLFRYCALTFNTHRIHYDHAHATGVEGYPALVVNGNLTALMLTELFRERAGREPVEVVARNIRPLFCGRPNSIHARPEPGGDAWRVWAEDDAGRPALDATVA